VFIIIPTVPGGAHLALQLMASQQPEAGKRFRRDELLHNWLGNGEASGSEVPSKGTNLDSGASCVSIDNLVL
jgi:hypothetical protein